MFRALQANEIEVRVQQVKKTDKGFGCVLLLYKDARCDMKILDEKLGTFGWQRDHKELKGNIYCGVSIQNPDTKEWITKWDCGSESFTEKEKGESSDSFKRACFNLGIGRELYTGPFIWVNLSEKEVYCTNKDEKVDWKKKYALQKNVKFYVYHLTVKDHVITELGIRDSNSNDRYKWRK